MRYCSSSLTNRSNPPYQERRKLPTAVEDWKCSWNDEDLLSAGSRSGVMLLCGVYS